MSVYKAINAVQASLSKTGIAKLRDNTQGSGYKFRGIDDVYNAVAPLLAEHGLCILPRMLTRSMVPQTSKSGGNLFYVTVEAEFDVVCAEDGSKHTIKTFGEAMDSGDKATNKAMSAAYKYGIFQMFCVPTEGDNDADATTHELMNEKALAKAMEKNKIPANEFIDLCTAMSDAGSDEELEAASEKAAVAAKKYGDKEAAASFKTKYLQAQEALKI